VWETADNGLMVFVTGITNSHNSRVIVVTVVTAAKNATECAHWRSRQVDNQISRTDCYRQISRKDCYRSIHRRSH
jgi:hypothetical protein